MENRVSMATVFNHVLYALRLVGGESFRIANLDQLAKYVEAVVEDLEQSGLTVNNDLATSSNVYDDLVNEYLALGILIARNTGGKTYYEVNYEILEYLVGEMIDKDMLDRVTNVLAKIIKQ